MGCNKRLIIQGGAVAAPVAGQILGEVLPYLELKNDNEETSENIETVITPDVKYKTVEEAEKLIKEAGLNIKYEQDLKNSQKSNTVISQIPSAGIKINKGSSVIISAE